MYRSVTRAKHVETVMFVCCTLTLECACRSSNMAAGNKMSASRKKNSISKISHRAGSTSNFNIGILKLHIDKLHMNKPAPLLKLLLLQRLQPPLRLQAHRSGGSQILRKYHSVKILK